MINWPKIPPQASKRVADTACPRLLDTEMGSGFLPNTETAVKLPTQQHHEHEIIYAT